MSVQQGRSKLDQLDGIGIDLSDPAPNRLAIGDGWGARAEAVGGSLGRQAEVSKDFLGGLGLGDRGEQVAATAQRS